jgi:hypothetical protein
MAYTSQTMRRIDSSLGSFWRRSIDGQLCASDLAIKDSPLAARYRNVDHRYRRKMATPPPAHKANCTAVDSVARTAVDGVSSGDVVAVRRPWGVRVKTDQSDSV